MPSTTHRTDAVIIGAGPVGLFAIFQCGMLRIKCHVVDALDHIGGQLTALYPEKPIYDIPAYPTILAGDLVSRLEAQIKPFDPTFHLGRRVVGLTRLEDARWLVETDRGETLNAAVVFIAAGAGAFGPNRPPLEGLEVYEGASVFYCVARRDDFRGKDIVIAGGGDSAVDWALSLWEIANSVKVVHRRSKFRCAPESAARLRDLADRGAIDLVTPYQLSGLKGENGVLNAVEVKDLNGAARDLKADALLPFFGLAARLGPIAHWGLAMERSAIRIDPTTARTDLEGVFAMGDICAYPHKLKLILTGFAEAAQAAHAAYPIVNNGEQPHFQHSTTVGVPTAPVR